MLLAATLGLMSAGNVHAQTPAVASAFPTLRVVGGLDGVNQYRRLEAPFWSQRLSQLSGGRYRASIVPFDRAGVPGADLPRLLQLGMIPLGTLLISQASASHPSLTMVDLAGQHPNSGMLQSQLAFLRPRFEQQLSRELGVKLLGLYTYPAQMLFCRFAINRLDDLKGRRVRVSSPTQADLMSALGAQPVLTGFAQIVANFQAGNLDCAITGSMSGHTIGLYRHTSHLYPLPINWGLSAFVVNQRSWDGFPADLQRLLLEHLPELEASIWAEALRETDLGIACNGGLPSCPEAEKGRMTIVPVHGGDVQRLRSLFSSHVLPAWQARCGPACETLLKDVIPAQ